MRRSRSAFAVFIPLALFACDQPGPSEPGLAPGPGSERFWAASEHGGGPPASVVFYSARLGNPKIYVMNADGTGQQVITGGTGGDFWPDLSPDGRFVAFRSSRTGNNEIFVADLAGGTPVNISNDGGDDDWPRWSPNGQRIAFHSNRDGNYNVYTVNPDGTDLRPVTNDPVLDQWPDWSPDGRQLAFRRGMDVYVLDAGGEEQNVRGLTNLPTLDQMPVWSPDGRQIAFMSLRDGYPSVFLMSADGDTPAQPAINLTPKDPADAAAAWLSRAPAWSMNGQQIYFMSRRPSTGNDVEIFVMNADGSGVTRLTFSAGEDGGPQTR